MNAIEEKGGPAALAEEAKKSKAMVTSGWGLYISQVVLAPGYKELSRADKGAYVGESLVDGGQGFDDRTLRANESFLTALLSKRVLFASS